MKSYYVGKGAASYNRSWKTFSERTLAATSSTIDLTQLQELASTREVPLRILDVACGTGLLLQQFAILLPTAELYGLDASQDMLAQSHLLLGNNPRVHLSQVTLTGTTAGSLPYDLASFDLITFTNSLHYMDNPVTVLRALAALLTAQGQLVLEDYARRIFPFPWRLFEWFIKQVDPQHVQAYTLAEAQKLCQEAGLKIITTKTMTINLLWRGWVISAHA
ncbi:class I SAM-dependent methyltransferase [Tengunoibacter tsumagoiensis]|uniref:Methyltransferase type 12 domain-containing protein n=1 Tax=Tengunoibacter tsumagoiensis TaxID=2014871 RepID=A0A401ZZS3_9CHLR|nr:class I SAM-dependent methyltransferase [Tengunoibacter tsumagoiensis]GCE12387.1 hypothetical protein KTT_22460 [Tengunoibacter tsumagoiensis]